MSQGPWYDVAFDSLYPEIYADRNDAEAERVISWLATQLVQHIPESRAHGRDDAAAFAGEAWVDLACGTGRHWRALARRGGRAFGIDRSRAQIRNAAAARPSGAELVLGDLRHLPFQDASFDGALSMFTSIGYFEDDQENRDVLAEAARVVTPGGWFLVDFLNAEWAVENLVPVSSRIAGSYRVEERRRIERERGRFVKDVAVFRHPGGEPVKRHTESVAFWSADELEARATRVGFVVRARAGDYDGSPFTSAASPRAILLAERRT